MDHDLSRLPKWAQQEITVLRMRVAELRATIAEGPESNTIATGLGIRPDRPLGMCPRIRFRMGDHEYIDAKMSAAGELEIHASGKLAILPRVTNAVYLRVMSR